RPAPSSAVAARMPGGSSGPSAWYPRGAGSGTDGGRTSARRASGRRPGAAHRDGRGRWAPCGKPLLRFRSIRNRPEGQPLDTRKRLLLVSVKKPPVFVEPCSSGRARQGRGQGPHADRRRRTGAEGLRGRAAPPVGRGRG